MEITIITLVLLTFVAGVVGGLVIAEAFDMDPSAKRAKRREKQRARHHREMKRQIKREQEIRQLQKNWI